MWLKTSTFPVMACSFLQFLPVLVGAYCERKGERGCSRFSFTKRLSNMFVLAVLLTGPVLGTWIKNAVEWFSQDQ